MVWNAIMQSVLLTIQLTNTTIQDINEPNPVIDRNALVLVSNCGLIFITMTKPIAHSAVYCEEKFNKYSLQEFGLNGLRSYSVILGSSGKMYSLCSFRGNPEIQMCNG